MSILNNPVSSHSVLSQNIFGLKDTPYFSVTYHVYIYVYHVFIGHVYHIFRWSKIHLDCFKTLTITTNEQASLHVSC